MDTRPVDLPELRAETRRDVAASYPAIYEAAIRTGKQPWRPVMPPGPAAVHMVNAEVARLGTAELFYVSADMAALAKTAARTMPNFMLTPEDVPAPTGFVYFDEPVDSFVNHSIDDATSSTAIVAASWGPWSDAPRQWPYGGLWVTWYADREAGLKDSPLAPTPEARQWYRQRRPRFLLHNETPVPFGTDEINTVDSDGNQINTTYAEELEKDDSLLPWLGALKATWLLMQQPLARLSNVQPDRPTRKRLRRAGGDAASVRVIELRRPAHSGSGDGSREFHHQWIVKGHWRQQWYPARKVHRPVWIAPHIKGPEGAPLIGGEKVYAWKR